MEMSIEPREYTKVAPTLISARTITFCISVLIFAADQMLSPKMGVRMVKNTIQSARPL